MVRPCFAAPSSSPGVPTQSFLATASSTPLICSLGAGIATTRSGPRGPPQPVPTAAFGTPVTCSIGHTLAASVAAATLTVQSLFASQPPFSDYSAPQQSIATAAATTSAVSTPSRLGRRRSSLPESRSPAAAFRLNLPRLPRQVKRLRLRSPPEPLDAAAVARRAELRRVSVEAWDIFRERYVDQPGIDWARLRNRLDRRTITNEGELHDAIDWMLAQAGDQFTRFLPRPELDAMKEGIDGEMCGVGIIFDAETHGWRRTKRVIVKEVVAHSPAADAGFARGDAITAIDTASIRRMSVDEATNRLLGKEGNKVSISFIRCADGLELSVTLTRRRFSVPTVSAEAVQVAAVGRVAFIQVREFAASTALQARRGIRQLMVGGPLDAIVIDLRGNSGGLVDQAVEFAKIFLDKQRVVVRFVGRDDAITTERSEMRWLTRQRIRLTSQPVFVLTDESTASASELVAAALRDNCRALIIGSSTYGKGSVQAIAQLSDGAGVAVTVARYRTPANMPIHAGRGLKPDIFRSDMAVDSSVVQQVFGQSSRRLKWMKSKISSCSPA